MPDTPASQQRLYLRTAVPAPLSQLFDYLPPTALNGAQVQPGMRVLVPFGRSRKVAVVVATGSEPGVAATRVRPAIELLDTLPTVTRPIMRLAQWAADYYAHPLGDVMHGILPPPARLAQQCQQSHL